MADNVVWSTLFLGNFADLDPNESTAGMDNPSPLLTTFGGGAGNALATNIVDVHTYTGFADDTVDTNNGFTTDYMQYNLGAGTQTVALDSVIVLAGTVTFYDGSTYTSNFGVMQDDTGNVFMLVLDSQPELASQGVDSVTFTSVVQNDFGAITQSTKDNHDFVCFGPGTLIATPLGEKRADKLRVGDYVTTLDDGPQPIRWIGKRRMLFDPDAEDPARPVLIPMGAMGHGLPHRDTLVSPNHRVLVATRPTHALHDPLGALAPAKALTRQGKIRVAAGRSAITYFTLLLPEHAVIFANGVAMESLYPGPAAFATLTGPQRSAWLRLAADARVTGTPPARLLLSTAEARAGLDAGAMGLPERQPTPLSWSARNRRRARMTRPLHLARTR